MLQNCQVDVPSGLLHGFVAAKTDSMCSHAEQKQLM